jgi:hypothetical protein
MRERLTSAGLATLDRALRFGDLVILPSEIDVRKQTKIGKRLLAEPWVRRRLNVSAHADMPWIALLDLRRQYEVARQLKGREPRWADRLPTLAKRHFRFSHYLGDGFDPLVIVPHIPHTGIGYTIADDGLMADAADTFRIFRLGGIRQLAFLHDPLSEGFALHFDHTRLCHVVDVMAIATLMATRNRIPRADWRALRVAALTHDVLTPAGGDTTKSVDWKAFDEDAHYPEAFERFAAGPFLRRQRLSAGQLASIVRNEGVLGRLLDIADKIAYVGRDAWNYVHRIHLIRKERSEEPSAYRRIEAILNAHPMVCGVWDSVVVADGQVFVRDGERLGDFLELRARLFRDLYFNPEARFLEHTLASIIIRDLYESGRLTRDRLLTMVDGELEGLFSEVLEVYFAGKSLIVTDSDHARVETFASQAAAERREDELEATGDYVVMNETFVGATSPGTKILVLKDGHIQPFSEAYPEKTEALLEIVRNDRPYRLYYFPVDQCRAPWFRGAMERYRARRAEARRASA